MKLYTYIVAHDTGFAPNPFWGYCTLACCKPAIRRDIGRHFNKDDEYWIVGLSKKNHGNKLIYAMRLTEEPLTFAEYFTDKRFKKKIPDINNTKGVHCRGDNIYRYDGSKFIQIKSLYHNTEENKQKDLRGEYVLVSNDFIYFGNKMKSLKPGLEFMITARGYRCNFTENEITKFKMFIKINRVE